MNRIRHMRPAWAEIRCGDSCMSNCSAGPPTEPKFLHFELKELCRTGNGLVKSAPLM